MGIMKKFLMEKTRELASMLGTTEADMYSNVHLSEMARKYAMWKFEVEQSRLGVQEKIKEAMLTRIDEVVVLLQELLAWDYCQYDASLEEYSPKEEMCMQCKYNFLCEDSTIYQK